MHTHLHPTLINRVSIINTHLPIQIYTQTHIQQPSITSRSGSLSSRGTRGCFVLTFFGSDTMCKLTLLLTRYTFIYNKHKCVLASKFKTFPKYSDNATRKLIKADYAVLLSPSYMLCCLFSIYLCIF